MHSGEAKAAACMSAVAPMSSRAFGSVPDASSARTARVSSLRTACSSSSSAAPTVLRKRRQHIAVSAKTSVAAFFCVMAASPDVVRLVGNPSRDLSPCPPDRSDRR